MNQARLILSVIPIPSYIIPVLLYVIPAKAGIHLFPSIHFLPLRGGRIKVGVSNLCINLALTAYTYTLNAVRYTFYFEEKRAGKILST